jgi:hypothetical protein
LLGQILAQRIRVLSDEDKEIRTRRPTGKIDKRMLHSLGYENENVFAVTHLVRRSPIMVDISVDASGSMSGFYGSGGKWYNAMKFAVAMAYASTKIRTLRVRINIRGTTNDGMAAVGIVFDSKYNKFIDVQHLFPYLHASGATPEGLCFEALRKEILEDVKQTRRFFINLSDGMPEFYLPGRHGGEKDYYGGEPAARHTRMQVEDIRKLGVSVLSYFITEGSPNVASRLREQFQQMYGKDAQYIAMSDVPGIVRTLNALFLKE